MDWSGSPWTDNSGALFGTTNVGPIAVAGPVAPTSITFNASGYSLSGGTINLGGNLAGYSGNSISSAINLTANSLWSANTGASAGTLTIGGAVSTGANTLVIQASSGTNSIFLAPGARSAATSRWATAAATGPPIS